MGVAATVALGATVTPTAPGRQLVRFTLLCPPKALEKATVALTAALGRERLPAALRPLTFYPDGSIRAALVTFVATFTDLASRRVTLTPRATPAPGAVAVSAQVAADGTVTLSSGAVLRWLGPGSGPLREETIEESPYFLWKRWHSESGPWARIIEVRTDALDGVRVIGHLQRRTVGDDYAPDFGWETAAPTLPTSLPARFRADDQMPLQGWAWRRVMVALGTAIPAATVAQPFAVYSQLYGFAPAADLRRQPALTRLAAYHAAAMERLAAVGKDAGNITAYNDGAEHGGVLGMNRLNHGLALFAEGFRRPESRLLETALAWCENFHDLSIWWGPEQTGGTRYNNVAGMNQTPRDTAFMWRSHSAVSFCTKGYDCFFVAYEQTGDPRMKAALDAQLAYASRYLHAGKDYTRNVGDVRDFLNLYRWTGDPRWKDEALRLFGDLRACLSTGSLFTESGRPIVADPPFIDDDSQGYANPFAKPYIVGYALAGLPELALLTPDDPQLKATVAAVARFLAESQDPLGGWRYPHPRSTTLLLSQALEHAWQLQQAARLVGPQPWLLDAIERVLRQRLHGWKRTGKVFSALTGWERATGKATDTAALRTLYAHPTDRDFRRDYTDGTPGFGNAPPEGLVYFSEVLAFYLKHRSAGRLLAPPTLDEPLGQVLSRVPTSGTKSPKP